MFFFLHPHVFLVQGAHNGALYDLIEGKLFNVSLAVKKILLLTETGISISDFGKSAFIVENFLKYLASSNLGEFSKISTPPAKIEITIPKHKLYMMWLSLNSNCNLSCEHCYATSEPGPSDYSIPLDNIFQAMKEALYEFDLECVQLIGGEPLLLGKEKVTAIIEEAHKIGIPTIEVFTNGHLIDNYYLKLFKEKQIHVAISIYSYEPNVHDKVTNFTGSWEKTVGSIKKIRSEGIPIRFGIVATTTNQKTLDNTISWIKNEFGVLLEKPYDVVRTCGRGANSDIVPWDLFLEQYVRLKPNFYNISIQSFQHSLYGNVCWANEICILPNGDVTPCEMEHDIIQGNIKTQRLRNIILGSGGDEAQRLTKDKIDICCDCEYRYACWECRAMTHQLDNEKYKKPLTCMYNPYTSIWEKPPNNLIEMFPKLLSKPSK